MSNPVTKLGVVRRLSYYPDRRVLRVTTTEGRIFEARDVANHDVDAAQPFDDGAKIERLVDTTVPWRHIAGAPPRPPTRPLPLRPAGTLTARLGARRMSGRFRSPFGLVQSVTYDRLAERFQLTLSAGGRYESAPVRRDVARSLFPIRARRQFDRLLQTGGEWRPLDASALEVSNP